MATRYQFVDDSGETRLAGFLVPEPGGSVPGVGDFLCADINNGPTIVNNAGEVVVTFDNGVVAGGAGSITLNAGKDTIQCSAAGVYRVDAYILFDAADPTGVRAINATVVTGPVPNTVAGTHWQVTGAAADGGGAYAAGSWPMLLAAAGTIQIAALVKGAAGDIPVNYGFVTVTKTSALGS